MKGLMFPLQEKAPPSVRRDRHVGVPGLSLRSQELERSPEFPHCRGAPVQRESSLRRNPHDTATLPFGKLHLLIYFAWCVSLPQWFITFDLCLFRLWL